MCDYTKIEGEEASTIILVTARDFADSQLVTTLTEREKKDYYLRPESKRMDWLLGRAAAKRACVGRMTALGMSPAFSVEIWSQGRIPVCAIAGKISDDLVLAISHTKNTYGVAVVAAATRYRGIGVDIEIIRDFSEETVRSISNDLEFKYWLEVSGIERNIVATAMWSLKEAYMKASGKGLIIHPRTIDTAHFLKSGGQYRTNDIIVRWKKVSENSILATVYLLK